MAVVAVSKDEKEQEYLIVDDGDSNKVIKIIRIVW